MTTQRAQVKKARMPEGAEVVHLFVYGTLRSKAHATERMLLAQHATRVGIGRIANARLYLGKYPYAVPSAEGGEVLVGEVYRSEPNTLPDLLRKLDKYEEYYPHDIQGSLYRREVVQVRIGKTQVSAWIYWYNRPVRFIHRLPHGNYLKSQMHVVPDGSRWAVKMSGAEKATTSVASKAEAVSKARKLARKDRMMLVIHGRDGRIQERIPAVKDRRT